jgi:hypothetical protein
MPSPEQKPLQPLQTLPSALELHSVISSGSLEYFQASAGEKPEKESVSGLTRERASFSALRARGPRPNLSSLSPIRCSRLWEGHNVSNGSWFDSVRCLSAKLAASNFLVPLGQLSASKFRKGTREIN